jgi:CubicO group peptidase (beta-lactamase class C family)
MKRLSAPYISMFLILIAQHIYAQQEFPETPIGEKLQQLLQVLESDNHKSFIEKNFSENFLNQFPMEEHISFFLQIKMKHGGFTLQKIESGIDYKLTALVKSKKRQAWRRIDLSVEQNKPHKITGFGIDMAQPPADIHYTGSKYDLVSDLRPDANAINKGKIADKIDKHLTRMEERGYSGAILVAKGGDIILAKGYGYANRENKVPFHIHTAFDIGSITKQFTGATILKLEMLGKLSTNNLISKYFKSVPDDKKSITIHHLLTHAAGFREALGFDYKTISREDFIKLAFDSKLKYKPGERYLYSNVGYSLLAAIMEIVTGDRYEKFLQTHLFKPAGMHYTGYSSPTWEKNQVAHGYRGEEYFGLPNKKNWANDGPWWHLRGNGGIISTIFDMYKWHLALEGETILSKASKKKYYRPHISEGPAADTHYGYGWVIAKSSRGTTVYMHNGGSPYFANDCYRYVDDDVFVYITSNNGEMSAIEQSGMILKMIFY